MAPRAELPISDGELCTRCAAAPIADPETGWCRACSLRLRAAAHEREAEEIERREANAQRELDAARKRKQRARERVGV